MKLVDLWEIWRLEDCTLYVTVEPCPMCAGAIVQARIKKVVFWCLKIQRLVVLGLLLIYFKTIIFNHQVEIEKGVCADECATLMKDFFQKV